MKILFNLGVLALLVLIIPVVVVLDTGGFVPDYIVNSHERKVRWLCWTPMVWRRAMEHWRKANDAIDDWTT
jgi:hypothetical protein